MCERELITEALAQLLPVVVVVAICLLYVLPLLQVVVLLPQALDIDLQLGLLLGRLIEQFTCGGQFLFIDSLQVGGLPIDGVLCQVQFLCEATILVLQMPHAIDIAGQTIIEMLQFLLLLQACGACGTGGTRGAQTTR